jgi:hypothetical protein
VKYLGFILSKDGLRPDHNKVKVVAEYPELKSVRDVRGFTGLCNYYRKFIKDFATIATPLNHLAKKGYHLSSVKNVAQLLKP